MRGKPPVDFGILIPSARVTQANNWWSNNIHRGQRPFVVGWEKEGSQYAALHCRIHFWQARLIKQVAQGFEDAHILMSGRGASWVKREFDGEQNVTKLDRQVPVDLARRLRNQGYTPIGG